MSLLIILGNLTSHKCSKNIKKVGGSTVALKDGSCFDLRTFRTLKVSQFDDVDYGHTALFFFFENKIPTFFLTFKP